MRTSNPTPWYRRAPIRSALVTLLMALVTLAVTSAVYAVAYVDPDTPPGGSTLPDAIYGYPYPPSGPPIRLVATGTNPGTQFFIVNPPPVGDPPYNPPLGTRLPNGIQIIRVTENEAWIATPPNAVVTELPTSPSATTPPSEDNGLTFAIGVTGNADQPAGSGTVAGRGYRIRVTRAPLTVTAVNASRRYGAPNPAFVFNVDGLHNGDTVEQVFQGALATPATSTSPVGSYQITQGTLALTPYGAARYTFNFTPGVLSVTRAPLTITANDVTRRVGTSSPAFTARYQGFLNNDGPADLDGTLTFTTPATTGSPAGTYSITPGGLSSNNYVITYVDGTLTLVEQNVPEIIWPDPAAIIYGTPLGAAQLNATASFDGQSVPGTFEYTPPAGTVLPAGVVQPLQVVFTPDDRTNFARVTANQTIRVIPAPLTVTAVNTSRPYGAPDPTFAFNVTGLRSGDTVAQVFQGALETTATRASPAGNNAQITQGSLALTEYGAARYIISEFVPGTLNVTRASLTITANNVTRLVGKSNPAFTATFSGFANNDGPADLAGELNFSTSATASSPPGTYPIVPGGLSSPNYDISYVNGTLTVTNAQIYLPLLFR
ncbi:MAG: MBG domain-containing protein [Chloroflexaceae bacterium]